VRKPTVAGFVLEKSNECFHPTDDFYPRNRTILGGDLA